MEKSVISAKIPTICLGSKSWQQHRGFTGNYSHSPCHIWDSGFSLLICNPIVLDNSHTERHRTRLPYQHSKLWTIFLYPYQFRHKRRQSGRHACSTRHFPQRVYHGPDLLFRAFPFFHPTGISAWFLLFCRCRHLLHWHQGFL